MSGIPPGCGTNRNERTNKHFNKFLPNNKIGHLLPYTRCFRLFAKLKGMKAEASKFFNAFETNLSKVKDFSVKNGLVREESFGTSDSEYKLADRDEQWKMNNVNQETLEKGCESSSIPN